MKRFERLTVEDGAGGRHQRGIATGIDQCVLSLVVLAVSIVGIVVSIISALSSCIVLELLNIVSETHFEWCDWWVGVL